MKMIFAADEVVKVREQYYGTWEVKKQEIADFLISEQRREEEIASNEHYMFSENTLERAVILSNLTNVISIEIAPASSNHIKLYPIGTNMLVNESIINFIRSKAK